MTTRNFVAKNAKSSGAGKHIRKDKRADGRKPKHAVKYF